MDLLFRRYANPYIFLDSCILSNEFSNAIDFIFKEDENEKLWDLYLHTLPLNEKSFEDWKNGIIASPSNVTEMNVDKTANMTKEEVDATIQKTQKILRNFKPPKKGGKS